MLESQVHRQEWMCAGVRTELTAVLTFSVGSNVFRIESCVLVRSLTIRLSSSISIHRHARASDAETRSCGSTTSMDEIRFFAEVEISLQYSSWNSKSPFMISSAKCSNTPSNGG